MITTNINNIQNTNPLLIFNISISNITAKKILTINDNDLTIDTILMPKSSKSYGISGKNMKAFVINHIDGKILDYCLKLKSKVISSGTINQTITVQCDGESIYQLTLTNNTGFEMKQKISITMMNYTK